VQQNIPKHQHKELGSKLLVDTIFLMIVSPCISICKTDPVTGYCYGCGRSNFDKKTWKSEETTDQWKKQNLIDIQKRLKGWQLESFKDSYEHKLKNGVSLFKKELLK